MTTPDPHDLEGRTAVDVNGAKIGKIGTVYVADGTSEPLWVTVSTGLFGTRESFAPLYGSSIVGDNLQLSVTKDMIKDAPGVEADGHISESENDDLYRYYDGYLGQAGGAPTVSDGDPQYSDQVSSDQYATGGLADQTGTVGRDVSGPTTDNAMTRSEERLRVGTEQVAAGRVRLRKYVVTENVTQTVPVSHEEVRLEREPITDANYDAATSGADITEEEHEVILHAERPVVAKETVPVERVRLGTETVTEQHEVNETLRKEQIDEPDVEVRDVSQ